MRSSIFLLLSAAIVLTTSPAPAATSSRSLVGHVMALLSVFEQADVLPPENSPEANELIHALIQTQAALTKSDNPATRRWFQGALQPDDGKATALTSRTLEAILTYAALHPPEEDRAVLAGFREFNVTPADVALMARVYGAAASRLRADGQDIHALYDKERQKMPLQ